MASSCMSTCINDARVPAAAAVLRPTYVNLYKWPESDAEFVRSRSSVGRCQSGHAHAHARVVDSLSCRQVYLRSYTFSRKKEGVHAKISRKCFGRVIERVKNINRRKRKNKRSSKSNYKNKNKNNNNKTSIVKKKCMVLIRRAKEASCAALLFMSRRLLSCSTSKVDVADNYNDDHHLHDQRHG
ncbi:hypothetical protein ACOSP7_016595 [Xanthoceras sorbifolium]